MEFIFANLIFIFVVNVLFFFSGICLNSLVIVSFWRSVQLRKKLCYFTIMVLSCRDLLAVVISHLLMAFEAMLLITENRIINHWLYWSVAFSKLILSCSVLALLVMSFDRYLATHYPILHRTSVTKGKLLALFSFLVIIKITIAAISEKDLVIPYSVGLLIFGVPLVLLLFFINYKLFTVARKRRRNKEMSPEMKKSFSLKNISSCLMVVACLIGVSIPTLVFIILELTLKPNEFTDLVGFWGRTVGSMNSTFNCLIFYWKDNTLRIEGIKVIKSMKICRRDQTFSDNIA